ncbi:MAG: FlgD immunoglobulin-like domain containing protein [Candidatus Eisenbacteria bacterium]
MTGGGDVDGDGLRHHDIGADAGRMSSPRPGSRRPTSATMAPALTRNLPQLHLAGSSTRISTGGRQTHSFETIAIQLNARSACGRSDVRPELDRRLLGTAFAGVTHTGPYLDTGAPVAGQGSELLDTRTYSGFFLGSSFHWRIRNHSVNPFFPHTPWFYPQGNSPMATDVRMLPVTADAPEPLVASARLELAPPMPNPTAATTTIRFELATPGSVRLALYDASGREVRELLDTPLAAGRHSAQWDGRDAGGRAVASGVYFARLVKGASVATQKVVVRR